MHSYEFIVFCMQSALSLGRVFSAFLPARHGGRLPEQQRLASGFFLEVLTIRRCFRCQ